MASVMTSFNLASFPSLPFSVTGLSAYLLVISHHLAVWPWKDHLKPLDFKFFPQKEEWEFSDPQGPFHLQNPATWFYDGLSVWLIFENKWERRFLQLCQLFLFCPWLHWKLPKLHLDCKGWHCYFISLNTGFINTGCSLTKGYRKICTILISNYSSGIDLE